MTSSKVRPVRRLTVFVFVMLVIEFLDEFAFSASEAAWSLIRDTFDLTYVQIGLLTTIPTLISIGLEPVIGLFADTNKRRPIMVVGGLVLGTGFVLYGLAPSYDVLMLAIIIIFPASGSFVGIAQAALMDNNPERRENSMALWTFSGSMAVVAGPIVFALLIGSGASWRVFFLLVGSLVIVFAIVVMFLPSQNALRSGDDEDEAEAGSVRENIRIAWALLKRKTVWHWLILLQFSDLLLDVMFSLLALYLVDVVGVSPTEATFAIAVWTGVGLLGDFLLIPLLERVSGLSYLSVSVVMELILYPLFLLVDVWVLKLVLLGVIGLFNAGWYAILQSKLYDELGEQSGAVLIIGNAAGLLGAMFPIMLGIVAETAGLNVAMWLLMAGPIVLLIGLARVGDANQSFVANN